MRILHIVDSGGVYGKEQVVLNLIEEQQTKVGCVSQLMVMGTQDLVEEARSRGICVEHIPSAESLFATLVRRDNQRKLDIVHVHDYKSSIILGLMSAVGIFKVPLVRTLHGYTSTNKPWYARIRLYEALDRFSHRYHRYVVGVSENMREFDTVTDIVPNGIRPFVPDHFTIPNKFWDYQRDNLILMCSARLSAETNVEGLIRAIPILQKHRKALPHNGSSSDMGIRLYLFGDGPLRNELEAVIEQLNLQPEDGKLDEVFLMGFQKNARDYLRAVSVYLQPSFTEGMPISILEAMCAGTFIIATSVGGMKSLIDQNCIGICSPSPESIANAIIRYRQTEFNQERTQMIISSFDLFHSAYSNKAMADRYHEIYEHILGVQQCAV